MDNTNSPSQSHCQYSTSHLDQTQLKVTQKAATEKSFSGKYWNHWDQGTYTCVVCGSDLFKSDSKFDNGKGWPAFNSGVSENMEKSSPESYLGDKEIHCKQCKAHLGHIFEDNSQSTGIRYCINSASLSFYTG